ncbi:hypothetical protein [Pseudomonas typographi]|uniref:Lipoprotein n=1 Tax=Pseudomonas typographi TaxID=2715964 RepID=A0ABR7YYE5_9PSED|nr:hypothetical protein [Pseudomonas typographi]MBD1598197.1 hypothetical protein [Pseudomonas typographi]
MSTRLSFLQLTLGVALGLWLGFVAIALSGWLAWRHWGPLALPLATLGGAPPAAVLLPAPAPPTGSSALFEQYQQNLHRQQLRQAEQAARADASNQGNPQCQFWLEQTRTAPTDANRENVARFCN